MSHVPLPWKQCAVICDEKGQRLMRVCADPVHVFAEIPGRCQCGEEYWGDLFPELAPEQKTT